MKLKSLMLLTTGAALAAPAVIAQDMTDEMTIVMLGWCLSGQPGQRPTQTLTKR